MKACRTESTRVTKSGKITLFAESVKCLFRAGAAGGQQEGSRRAGAAGRLCHAGAAAPAVRVAALSSLQSALSILTRSLLCWQLSCYEIRFVNAHEICFYLFVLS